MISGSILTTESLFIPAIKPTFAGKTTAQLLWRRLRAHLTFWQLCLSPSPPHTCGGEGRGEEVRSSIAPLLISLPARRGEGTLSDVDKIICQKVRCAHSRPRCVTSATCSRRREWSTGAS